MAKIGPSRVFVDSNVLMSRTLRDWLAMLALARVPPAFHVYWTEDVIADVIHHLRKQHPNWPGHTIATLRDRLVATFEGGRVDDFVVDGSYQGRDVDDAHVHAAASHCQADYLLTANLADFPDGHTPYEALSPDAFFVVVDDSAPDLVREVTQRQMHYWASRREESLLPEHLEKSGCPVFAQRVRQHQGRIGGLPLGSTGRSTSRRHP